MSDEYLRRKLKDIIPEHITEMGPDASTWIEKVLIKVACVVYEREPKK